MGFTLRGTGAYVFRESGLASVYAAGPDAWLIIFSRSCRMLAYGASSLVLALFFSELHFSDARIGLFMTLTLAGDVALSLLLTLLADRVLGRRRTLFLGACLMVASGATFAISENFWALLAAAVLGVISATGGDFGPFRAVEESMLSELTRPATRADVLVWHVTTASLGSAISTEFAGRLVEWLHAQDGWTLVDAYHACFWVYTIMGVLNVVSSALLSERCELHQGQGEQQQEQQQKPGLEQAQEHVQGQVAEGEADETRPLLSRADDGHNKPAEEEKNKKKNKSALAQVSRETLSVMVALWILLMVDSLADGMVSLPLTAYYLDQKFHLPKSSLGDLLGVSFVLASCSTIFAGPLARRIGLVNTMVFTHIPSSAAVLLFPLPRSTVVTFALFLVRVGLNNMDQAPRTALIAAVVRPEERTAIMGITGMLRTLASMMGPSVTGVLAGGGRFWIAFVAAGSLRLAYDLGLFAMFINIKLYRHEPSSASEVAPAPPLPVTDRREPDEEERAA